MHALPLMRPRACGPSLLAGRTPRPAELFGFDIMSTNGFVYAGCYADAAEPGRRLTFLTHLNTTGSALLACEAAAMAGNYANYGLQAGNE